MPKVAGVQSSYMKRNLPALIISFGILLFLSRLPVFPLVTEVREFSQDGESLYQTWEFVSLGEFYDAAQFAKAGWMETTWRNYMILFVVNHAGLVAVFVIINKLIKGMPLWKRLPA